MAKITFINSLGETTEYKVTNDEVTQFLTGGSGRSRDWVESPQAGCNCGKPKKPKK